MHDGRMIVENNYYHALSIPCLFSAQRGIHTENFVIL